MAEELKQLIKKIQSEGVKAAENKARGIEEAANKRAEAIVNSARKEAEGIIADGANEAAKMKASGEVALKQAGRDLLIALKKEVNGLLDKLIASGAADVLTPEKMAVIITTLIEGYGKGDGDISVLLNKKDLDALEKGFSSKLSAAAKKGITLRSSDTMRAGFSISYDGGESHFDFTDESLAEYLGAYLKPTLAGLLKESASGKKAKKG